MIRRSHGIVLVTGPTGSGKTTTLYAALRRINTPDLNILTVEDPVEYQLKGIGQMAINPKIGLTFAAGLRSFLRQDPDVIMVGEIRDRETAEIAIQASLTGHLVFSTVHTNDAAGAVTRLVDMGVEPFLVASSLTAVLAQRLVRRVVPGVPRAVPAHRRGAEGGRPHPARRWPGQATRTIYRATGCDVCSGNGYRGRTGIYELLMVDDDIRQLVAEERGLRHDQEGREWPRACGPCSTTARARCSPGETTIAEVLSVTQEDI